MCTTAAGSSNAGMGLQLGGGIMSAFGSQSTHDSNANYLTTMSNITQAMASNAANSAEYAGGMAASAASNKGKAMVESQKTYMASHGLASGSTTYNGILDNTVDQSEKDALAIQYNADMQAWNIKTQANLQSAQYLSQANAEKTAGKTALVSGLLSTASQFSDTYNKWNQTSKGVVQPTTTASNPSATTAVMNTQLALPTVDSTMPDWKKLSYGGRLW